MKKESLFRTSRGIFIADGDNKYQMFIDTSDAGGVMMWSFVTPIDDQSWDDMLDEYNNDPPDEEELSDKRSRFPDEEVFRIFDILKAKGYVLTEEEKWTRLGGGQMRIDLDADGNLLQNHLFNIPGKPYPKNAEELKLRLLGKF